MVLGSGVDVVVEVVLESAVDVVVDVDVVVVVDKGGVGGSWQGRWLMTLPARVTAPVRA